MVDFAKVAHSFSLRIPQQYHVRSGLRIRANSKQEHIAFWRAFTSDEFYSLVPFFIKTNLRPSRVIDCGAACGYFSLVIEHLNRIGIFDWEFDFILVEPASFNIPKLKSHFQQEGLVSRTSIFENVVGLKSGSVTFEASEKSPFSGSLKHQRKNVSAATKNYLDITPFLIEDCFLKIDIEGSEFDFFKEYANDLSKIAAILIDWHPEHLVNNDHLTILKNAGFISILKSRANSSRPSELFFNSKRVNLQA